MDHLCAGSKPSPPRHPQTCSSSVFGEFVLHRFSSSAIEGVCVALDGPRVRPLRLLLLALVGCVCWRWADVAVAEKFIYSLMLYTRFLLHSGAGWGPAGVLAGLHPGQVGSSSQSHNYVRTRTCGPILCSKFLIVRMFLDCVRIQENLKRTRTPGEHGDPRKTPWIEHAMFLLGGDRPS